MNKNSFIALLISLFFTANVVAGLIDNGDITTEERADGTTWEWLDVSLTKGFSYDSIYADLADGSLDSITLDPSFTEGWRYATLDEVKAMFSDYLGVAGAYTSTSYNEEGLVDLFGATYQDSYPRRYTWGRTAANASSHNVVRIYDYLNVNTADTVNYDSMLRDNNNIHHAMGSFLVRATSVPEPTNIAVLGFMLIAIATRRKKIH